ncbi:MAG: hypothetical protein JJU11_03450 [Candidatus Sumerlaeia bacterium]|nr:hypothetical protein [Candidatus Sumerlaeia bacterium]
MKNRLITAALLPGLLAFGLVAQGQNETDPFQEMADDLNITFVEPEFTDDELFEEDPTTGEETYEEPGVSIDMPEPVRTINLDASSVEDLQRLLNLPAAGQLREYQEDPRNPRSIFTSDEDVARIFGDTPEFIYFPEGVDPMIIPWVRERIASEEMWQEAQLALANGDFDRSINLLRDLRERFPGTQSGQNAPAEIERIIRQREEASRPQIARSPEEQVAPPVEEEAVLPEWVKRNTTGVLIGDRPMVIVGNDFLGEGDPVPRYASVRVKSIAASEVVYVYQDKDFVVEVTGTF